MEVAFNPFSLRGKTILVTGASSGIGKVVAVSCAKMGGSVAITGRNKEKLESVLSEMPFCHSSFVADLTKNEDIALLVSSLPKLDGVVHCAGVGSRVPCKMIAKGDIEQVMRPNFEATVILQAELLKAKKINKGASIVLMASQAAKMPSAGNAIYSASKGAIISYAKCLALELAPRCIRVNCVSPAMVWTNFIAESGLPTEMLREDELKYPLKRYGTPEDIANLCIYLLSDASSWMTGSDIDITGGSILL